MQVIHLLSLRHAHLVFLLVILVGYFYLRGVAFAPVAVCVNVTCHVIATMFFALSQAVFSHTKLPPDCERVPIGVRRQSCLLILNVLHFNGFQQGEARELIACLSSWGRERYVDLLRGHVRCAAFHGLEALAAFPL